MARSPPIEELEGRLTPPPLDDPQPSPTPPQRRALAALTAAGLVALIWIAHPVAFGLLLGTLTGFVLAPAYRWLARRTHRPELAALACALGGALAIGFGVVAFAVAIVQNATELATTLAEPASAPSAPPGWIAPLERHLAPLGLHVADLGPRLREGAGELASREYAQLYSKRETEARGSGQKFQRSIFV